MKSLDGNREGWFVIAILLSVILSPHYCLAGVSIGEINGPFSCDSGWPPQGEGSPCWNPDGTMIAFRWGDGYTAWDPSLGGYPNPEGSYIVIMTADGQAIRGPDNPLVNDIGWDNGQPDWIPDGSWIVYIKSRVGPAQILKVPSTGGDAVPITQIDGNWHPCSPKWSPDGTKIAYRGGDWWNIPNPKPYHVWLTDTDGSTHEDLTPSITGYGVTGLSWIPDGTEIVFTQQGESGLFVLNLSTLDIDEVTPPAFDLLPGSAVWAGENSILFDASGCIYDYQIDTQTITQLTFGPSDGLGDWHPTAGLVFPSARDCTVRWDSNIYTAPPVVEPDLLAHWKFDEGSGSIASDSSGYGKDGIIDGATWTTGKIGDALSFDGFDDWVDVPDDISTKHITLEAWIYPTGFDDGPGDQGNAIIQRSTGGAGAPGDRSWSWRLRIMPRSHLAQFQAAGPNTGVGSVVAPTALVQNRWYHLAATYDGNVMKIYVDGELKATNSNLDGPLETYHLIPVAIGCLEGWGLQHFQGIIDEVRVYGRALTSEEIAEHTESVVSSDWPMFHHDTGNTGYSTSKLPDDNVVMWVFETGGIISSSPAIVNGRVYIASEDGYVYCLDEVGGERNTSLLWKFNAGDAIVSSAAVVNDKVFIGSTDGYIYALPTVDPDGDGIISDIETIWKYGTTGGVDSSPLVTNGRVFIASCDLKDIHIYCLNADNGNEIWTYAFCADDFGIIPSYYKVSSPAFHKGKVFLSINFVYSLGGALLVPKARLLCFDADGNGDGTTEILWSKEEEGTIVSSPALSAGKVFVGNGRSFSAAHFLCFDEYNGVEIWRHIFVKPTPFVKLGVFSSPAVAYGKVYFGWWGTDGSGGLYSFDINGNGDGTTNLIWTFDLSDEVYFSSPAVADGKVFIGSIDGRIYALPETDPDGDGIIGNSEIIWSYQTGGPLLSSPSVANHRVFIGSSDGKVYCFGQLKPGEDTDADGILNDIEKATGTDPFDDDTDNDGLLDGPGSGEDTNANGILDTGETDPISADTDGDGIQDGTECGLVAPEGFDTDLRIFVPDANPSNTTNPTNPDTDGDGITDGEEDINKNGKVDPGESNPNVITGIIDFNPNNLNLKSKGRWVTCYFELSEGYDVTDITLLSISLNNTISPDLSVYEFGDYNGNGIIDLMVKFDRELLIEVVGPVRDGQDIVLTLTGQLNTGTRFEGLDTIKVIEPSHR